MRNIFLRKSCKNKVGRQVPDLFFSFEKALYIRQIQVVSTLVLTYFGRPLNMCIVINCCPVCDIIDLEINHNLQPVFLRNQNVWTKM